MRIAAAIIVLATLSCVGYAKSYGMQLRKTLLITFLSDISKITAEMRYRPRSIAEIARVMQGALSSLWMEFATLVSDTERAQEAWTEAVKRCEKLRALTVEEMNTIISFGEGIGVNGIRLQEQKYSYVAARLETHIATIEDEICRKGSMYRRLGVLAGAAAALIVI